MKPRMTFGDTLKFTTWAYAKLLYMRDKGPTEVAGYGVTGTEDPLLVTDFVLIKQRCTDVSFDFDQDDGVEYMERMLDEGLMPWQYSNLLVHTHPLGCNQPSQKDEETFADSFSHPNWAIMFIIAQNGKTYCRLKINVGPGVVKELKVAIDWSVPFLGSDFKAWTEEYAVKVTEEKFLFGMIENGESWKHVSDPLDKYEAMSRDWEKHKLLDVSELDCHWNADGDVEYWDEEGSIYYTFDPISQKWYKEEGELMKEISIPSQPWAEQVAMWANKYVDERVLATKEIV